MPKHHRPHQTHAPRRATALGLPALALAALTACAYPEPPPIPAARLDLAQLTGTWHEIARLPNDFEDGYRRRCTAVTLTYMMRADGSLAAEERCQDSVHANAQLTQTAILRATAPFSAKLRATYQPPFAADYWVFAIGPGDAWAVSGSPSRKYLWILARSATMAPQDYDAALAEARVQRFDTSRLTRTSP